jgi:hypothetical protein
MRTAQRGSFAVLALAVALLVSILAAAVQASRADGGPGGRAAELLPASALAYTRIDTRDDPEARALARLLPKLRGAGAARSAALDAISPGAIDLERDVRPGLGDEAAVALLDLGEGSTARSCSRRSATRRAPTRCSSASPGRGRPRATATPPSGASAATPRRSWTASSSPAPSSPSSARSTRPGDARSLKRSADFRRALSGARRPAELYVSARRARVTRTLAALMSRPSLRRARRLGRRRRRPPARARGRDHARGGSVTKLAATVPADAIAMLAAPTPRRSCARPSAPAARRRSTASAARSPIGRR